MKKLTVVLLMKGDFLLEERHLRRLRENHPQVEFRECDPDTVRSADLRDADALVGWPSGEMLSAAVGLRWLMLPSVGVNRYLGMPELRREVILTNSRGVFGTAGAEHGVALLLALIRDLPTQMRQQQVKVWKRSISCGEVNGRTVGVLGLGNIGVAFAEAVHALGARVWGMRRAPGGAVSAAVERFFTNDVLDALLPQMDIVFAALPETPATAGLMSRERIFSMKRGAYLVNVGRGSLLDEEALIEAARSGHLAGVGLDVTATEPLPVDSPLWSLPNVIVTAHSLGITPRKQDYRTDLIDENTRRLLSGEPLKNVVDLSAGY